ncbi:MAG: fused MFS/spermidine synthase [Planctomycetota bacterium]
MRTIADTRHRISVVRKAVLPLFLVSGAAGLIYEVTWTRTFGVVFGNTVFAVSTVLTAFMLGLALGSWLFGKIADRSSRPLRLYALLEVGIGAYVLGLPAILRATDIFYGWFFRSFHPGFYPLSLVRFALSVIILLIPTALMGGTLPILSKLWAVSSKKRASEAPIGQTVGILYAINTFGAVAGSFLSGYLLIRILGVNNTVYLAVSANILIGILSFILSFFLDRPREHSMQRPEPTKSEITDQQAKKRLVVLIAVAIAGLCALALEVLWTRVLVFALGTTAYAFACMLTCFIFGIAVGSFICSRLILARIKKPIFALGIVEFLVGLSVLGSVPLLGILWHIDNILTQGEVVFSFWREAAIHFVDASIVFLVPTVLMGMVFPIAVKICARSWKAAGKRIGNVYACNTVGCVIGSFMAGFVMVPLLGLRDSFLVIVAIQLFLAVVVIFFSERRRVVLSLFVGGISVAVLIAGVLFLERDIFLKTINTYHYPSEIVYLKDDATGTVTVHDLPDGDRLIVVDGVDVAGMDFMLRTTQKLQAYAPLLVHENPEKVLQIGFGSGETSGVGLAFGVEQYNIVEICPGVFEAAKFFEEINRGSYKDPRLRKIIMDGKNFVKLTDEKFDVIMNDSTYPGTTGSSALYTYDHFVQCREHLKPGGVLSCWVPLDLRPEDFSIIVRSFQAAMPYCSLWMVNNCLNKHAVFLGTLSPMRIDFQRVKKLVERPDISADLAEINIRSVYEFLDCFVVGEEGMRKIGADGPLNTDDKPSLEFGAAIKRDLEGCWIVVHSRISQNHFPVSNYVENMGRTEQESQQVRAMLEQYFKGTNHALRGLLAILQCDLVTMNREFEMAQKLNPEDRDVKSCLDEMRNEIKPLVAAVERTPSDVSLRSRLAKRYLLLQDFEHAAEQYNSFLGLKPDNSAGWNNLAICYNKLERFDKAILAFEKAIEYNPRFISAYLNLARVYEELGDLAKASQELEKAASISSASERFQIYDRLARSYFIQKEYALTLQTLEKALDLVPNDAELRGYLKNRIEFVKRAAEEAQQSGSKETKL